MPEVTEQGQGGGRARPLFSCPRPGRLFNSQVNGLPMRQPSLGGGWLVQKEGSKVKGVWKTRPDTVLRLRALMSMITHEVKLSLASCDT